MDNKTYYSDHYSPEQSAEVRALVLDRVQHPFAAEVFPSVSLKFFESKGAGIKAEFNNISLLADQIGGRMMVTLEDSETGAQITFGSCTELPFNLFHAPSLNSCRGTVEDWSRMVHTVGKGLRDARQESREVLVKYPAFVKMFGG